MEKFNLITRDLVEVINLEHLKTALTKTQPRGYWGTAPTGYIHIGHLYPLLKIKDIVDAGCHLTVLIADIHAFLDDPSTTYEKISLQTKYSGSINSFISLYFKCCSCLPLYCPYKKSKFGFESFML